jgi:LuxR family maltose regulon positive regulatory protein
MKTANQFHTLISTKYNIPRVSGDLVPRPHLINRLNDGLDRKLTLVCAPAGYGKTTLLSQWLADSAHPVAWLSLDENDNDLVVFLSYFVAAVQTIFPEAGQATRSLLEAPQKPPLDYITSTLINELAEQCEPFLLVLDDYHTISDAGVRQFMDALVTYIPLEMHLVLVSRTQPLLPLARLRAGGKMTEIRDADLRFSQTEIRTFLSTNVKMDLSEDAIKLLEEHSEGWVSALRLVALSMRRETDITAFTKHFKGTHGDVADYLVTEVLDHQPAQVQDFLLRTSILGRFCVPLCDALLGEEGDTANDRATHLLFDGTSYSRSVLDYLERANLFLVPLDYEGTWYRYHHLFQEMLHHRLRAKMSDDDINVLHCSASDWYAAHNYVEDALRHSLFAEDVVGAVKLIEAHRVDLLNKKRWRRLERWLNMLPDGTVQQQPALLLTRAWVVLYEFQLLATLQILGEVESLLDDGALKISDMNERSIRAEIDAMRSHCYRTLYDDVSLSFECAQRALKNIQSDHQEARGLALAFLCLDYSTMGRKEKAARLLEESITSISSQSPSKLEALISLSFIYLSAGELFQLKNVAETFLEVVTKEQQPSSIAWAHMFSGMVYYEWNEIERALQHFSKVKEYRYNAVFLTFHNSMIGLSMCCLAVGELEEAQEVIQELLDYSRENNYQMFLPQIDSFRARIALRRGEISYANRWARSVEVEEWIEPFYTLEMCSLTLAWTQILQGSEKNLWEAVTLLNEWLKDAESKNNTNKVIKILAHLALAYHKQDRLDDALITLERSLSMARTGSYVCTYVDLGSEMRQLLDLLGARGAAPKYIRYVQQAFTGKSSFADGRISDSIPPNEFIEPLSSRELEVLELLSQRLSNKEIAQALVISPQTVKTHARNIYQKLDVTGRAQAVSKAKSLGILRSD